MTTLQTTDPAIEAIDSLLSILHHRRSSGDTSIKLASAIDGALDERLRLISLAREQVPTPVVRRAGRPVCTLDGHVLVESRVALTDDAGTLLGLLSSGDILAGSISLDTLLHRYKAWWESSVATSGHHWKGEIVHQAATYYFKEIIAEIRAAQATILRETGLCYEVRLGRISTSWSSATSLIFQQIP